MKRTAALGLLAAMALVGARPLGAHCEIPCGIYDDELRAKLIAEHIVTIEKSMKKVVELAQAGEKNYNQLVRWIGNKEAHANKVQLIVTQYFMTQRLKPKDATDAAAHAKYVKQLALLHQMLVAAMKAKQTTDLAHVAKLRELLASFRTAYFGPQARTHLDEHHLAAGRGRKN